MKAIEQYFPVVLFFYAVQGGSNFLSLWKSVKYDHSIEGYWPVLPCLYKVVLTFESVNEILQCDHSNESAGQRGCFWE